MIETVECFSRGVQKSDRYGSYSMPLVFKNEDRTVKVLTLQVKVYEAEVSEKKEPERPSKKRLLSKTRHKSPVKEESHGYRGDFKNSRSSPTRGDGFCGGLVCN